MVSQELCGQLLLLVGWRRCSQNPFSLPQALKEGGKKAGTVNWPCFNVTADISVASRVQHAAQCPTVCVVSVPRIVNHDASGSSLWERNGVGLQNSLFVKWPEIDSLWGFFFFFKSVFSPLICCATLETTTASAHRALVHNSSKYYFHLNFSYTLQYLCRKMSLAWLKTRSSSPFLEDSFYSILLHCLFSSIIF